jgi:CRISPR/Cas system-associated exonuclease Cas4 (RecB family)
MERKLPDCPFRFERTTDNRPMFEDFAKKNHEIVRNGQRFYLYGTCDGIMQYVNDDGEILRVGLEIKSKQTTPAKTSLYSFKEAEEGHRKQCVAYSIMYDVDYYIILYVNAAKKSWVMSDADYQATPDIRAFGIEITQAERDALLDEFADIARCINEETPPSLDLSRWTFNNFKTACALSLTGDEYETLKAQVKRAMRSSLPDWKKQGYYDAFEFIKEVRERDDSQEAV